MATPKQKQANARAPEGFVYGSFAMHRDIRKALKTAAVADGVPLYEKLHRILCSGLGREDLIDGPSSKT